MVDTKVGGDGVVAGRDAGVSRVEPIDAHNASFFRQSGWLMIANIAGGVLMWAVHFLSKRIPTGEYGLFVAFLSITMCIPTIPLQMALARQTAKALATNQKGQLSGLIRLVLMGTFVLWVIGAIFAGLFHGWLIDRWQVINPAVIWTTLGGILFAMWMPIFWGVLQGQQNFLWLGWSMMLNGLGRLFVAALAVLVLGWYAAGIMTGVMLGMVVAAAIAAWQTRALWSVKPLPFDWATVARELIPLMIGFAAFLFLFTADTMFVKRYFTGDESGFYGSAGTLSRALIWLVGPLASVMFPRIVHSTAKSEKSDLMKMVLLGTAVLAIAGAVSLSLLAPWVVRFVYPAEYVKTAAAVLPWYVGAMVPLSVANVLLNNLLARASYKIVVPLCVLAVSYAFALTRFHDSLRMVLQTMGVCNLVLLGLCLVVTRSQAPKPSPDSPQELPA